MYFTFSLIFASDAGLTSENNSKNTSCKEKHIN